ncbi:MAG: ATP-binding protein, partial [Verrucomicrobiaceae bacterium]
MLQAHIVYLLTSFSVLAGRELRSPNRSSFRDSLWQGYVDLATIQTPLVGTLKDQNRVLDTDLRGAGLIHRIGSLDESDAPLSTRSLLRYDAIDEEDISDGELFRSSRESLLVWRILEEYRKLHPHADDGLSIAIYRNDDIQPVIAAADAYLSSILSDREETRSPYTISVTIFTESTDDCSVARWVNQWKERWESAETQKSLSHYRKARLSVSHRIVSPHKQYQQFVELVEKSLDVDIAILSDFIRAGSQGNDFRPVEPYDVRFRSLKFPVLEKPFCASSAPGQRLHRARVLSNRQFRLSTSHAEILARLKNPGIPQGTEHVVLGFGDYGPWQRVVDALHARAEWVVCVDPNIDERLISQRSSSDHETREIIGFGSGVGTHGEANYTVSTQQFRLNDIVHKLEASIGEVYSGWDSSTSHQIAKSVITESQRLSGLSLVRATGIGQYVRDFMAYA